MGNLKSKIIKVKDVNSDDKVSEEVGKFGDSVVVADTASSAEIVKEELDFDANFAITVGVAGVSTVDGRVVCFDHAVHGSQ